MRKDWYDLSWLEPPNADFSDLCANIQSDPARFLRIVCSYKLTEAQLRKIAVTCQALECVPPGFERLKLTILSNANCGFLGPALQASALRYGLWLDVNVEPMGQPIAAVLDPGSFLSRIGADSVLVAYTYHSFRQAGTLGDEVESRRAVEDFVSNITTVRDTARDRCEAATIVQTIPQAPDSLLGSLDARVPGTRNFLIDRFNHEIMAGDFDVVDVARLANIVGLSAWHDVSHWYWAKIPFAQYLIPVYADYVARHLGALRGRSRKCLVLDLDNTLWGGCIGDDGPEGIELGPGTPLGEAYLSIQRMALDLRHRGVVLAVCSKNDDFNARLPFKNHPEMLLREADIGVFISNWENKAANLEAIAEALALTTDALVFLDDDPAERELVRRELPTIAVPEVPVNEPALWPLIISAAGYFESAQFTHNDIQRAAQYADNVKRTQLMTVSRDLNSYLIDLQMEMEISSFVPQQRRRITQLINKSNQFNLTTRRYTDDQVREMEADSQCACFAARLKDKFGDNGIISVIICKEYGWDWLLDTWLMSCRVLGRRAEQALLNYVAQRGLESRKRKLIGYYVPTSKNKMVESHYEKLGFAFAARKQDGSTEWVLGLSDFKPFEVPIRICENDPGRI
jgi:FkbH-like protein